MLRADHVAGAVFIILGLLVFAISGDLPFGTLPAPGAGMMPEAHGRIDARFRDHHHCRFGGSEKFSAIDWSGKTHAALVVLITAVAVGLYQTLGFLITMWALLFALVGRGRAPKKFCTPPPIVMVSRRLRPVAIQGPR